VSNICFSFKVLFHWWRWIPSLGYSAYGELHLEVDHTLSMHPEVYRMRTYYNQHKPCDIPGITL
jgi:hypothetical protein